MTWKLTINWLKLIQSRLRNQADFCILARFQKSNNTQQSINSAFLTNTKHLVGLLSVLTRKRNYAIWLLTNSVTYHDISIIAWMIKKLKNLKFILILSPIRCHVEKLQPEYRHWEMDRGGGLTRSLRTDLTCLVVAISRPDISSDSMFGRQSGVVSNFSTGNGETSSLRKASSWWPVSQEMSSCRNSLNSYDRTSKLVSRKL